MTNARFPDRIGPKDFKSWFLQLFCWTFSIKKDSVNMVVLGGGAAT